MVKYIVIKTTKDTTSYINDNLNKDLEINKIKTTDVNILLNRVRLDRKRTLRKRIFFFIILTIPISLFVYYLII